MAPTALRRALKASFGIDPSRVCLGVPGSLVGVVAVDRQERFHMPSTVFHSARPTFLHSDRVLARAAQPLVRFLRVEAAGGIVLVAAAAIAVLWANSPWLASYQ